MTDNQKQVDDHSKSELALFVASLLFSFVLLLSLWFFVKHPNHRIGGVAWNGLFQILAPLFAGLFSIWFLFNAIVSAGKNRLLCFASALVLGASAFYCISRSFTIFMSV